MSFASPSALSGKKRAAPMTNAEMQQFNALIEDMDIEIESRCDELRQMSESLVSSLRISFRSQLTSLPLRVRQMPLAEFAGSQHAGSVVSVMEEQARAAQVALDRWVASTPLPSARATPMTGTARRTGRLGLAQSALKAPQSGDDSTSSSSSAAESSASAFPHFASASSSSSHFGATDFVAETPSNLRGAKNRALRDAAAAAAVSAQAQPALTAAQLATSSSGVESSAVRATRAIRASKVDATPSSARAAESASSVDATPTRYALRARPSSIMPLPSAEQSAPFAATSAALVAPPSKVVAASTTKSRASAVVPAVVAASKSGASTRPLGPSKATAHEILLAEAKKAEDKMADFMAEMMAPVAPAPKIAKKK